MSINNNYYSIAYNDFLYLSAAIDSGLYNNISVQAQQVVEKLLKSVAELICLDISDKIMNKHNLRAVYSEITKVDKTFVLNESDLSFLKDLYYDTRYPGDNFVCVTEQTCRRCINIMFNVINEVNRFRENNSLPTVEFTREKYECMGVNIFDDNILSKDEIAEYVGRDNVDEFLKSIPDGITPDINTIDLLINVYRNKMK